MKRRQPLQHVLAAGLLIYGGIDQLQRGSHSFVPVAEIVAAAILIALVLYERVGHHHLSTRGIAWVELAGGLMMLVEAFAKLEERHHRSFYVLSFVPPLILLSFAVFDTQVDAMRRLTSDDDRFVMRLRIFWRKSVAWRKVASWTLSATSIEVTLRSGRSTQFRFAGIENRQESMEWAAAQFARRVSAADEMPGREGDAGEREQNEVLVAADRRAD